MSELQQQLEAVLFWKGGPMTRKELSVILGKNDADIGAGLVELREALVSRGLSLVEKEDEVLLTTSATMSPLIEKLVKENLERDLGKAGLDTLSIVLYYGPVSRARIDYIRGVNSTFILRQLLIRGLVERVENPQDARSFLYKPTFELLSFLGITKIDELPQYAETRAELEQFEKQDDTDDAAPSTTAEHSTGETS